MNRRCKHVDITDENFILKAIHDCFAHKTFHEMQRRDIVILFAENNNDVHQIAKMISKELRAKAVSLYPVQYEIRQDTSNGKLRIIAIECAKQQVYDYIAYNALEDAASYIGYYQIACKPGMGQIFGAKVVQNWMNEKGVSYGIKADIKKCYPSITHRNMMKWLRRHIKNDLLLYLIKQLFSYVENGINTPKLIRALMLHEELVTDLENARNGLPIGSVLSIRLCALYIADIYHRVEDHYFIVRRKKKIHVIKHIMINLDDIYLFGSNARQMNKAMKDIINFADSTLHLIIKPSWQMLSLRHNDENAHMDILGYRVYRNRITMRRRNYVKLKKSLKTFTKHRTVKNARSLCARVGMFIKHTNSYRFCQKYNVYKIVRMARKVISNYDKSNFRHTAAGSQRNHYWGCKLVPNMP